jgi:hypothetical protein
MLRPASLTLLALAAGMAGESAPYLVPSAGSAATFAAIMSVGESGASGEAMCGVPDGLGAYDNGDGTFTLLMNQELGATDGKVRAHGNKGAFVSRWIINSTTLAVDSITDLNATNTSIHLWNGTGFTTGTTVYARLCSADLPAVTAFYNAATGKGTQNRIFMNGEETGAEGRAFAHVVTGSAAGQSWQIPGIGRSSWENIVACPAAQDTTVVIGLDDTTPGQLYVYVGTKRSAGLDIEKAGLVGGTLYGVRANGTAVEVEDENGAGTAGKPSLGGIAVGGSASFALSPIGNAENLTGAQVQTISGDQGVTEFLRPEDGAWDPHNPSDFYFVTTHRFDQTKDMTGATTAASRLYRLRFTDIANPAAGGVITMLLDGSEAHNMLDNVTVDGFGRVIMQEDPGGQQHAARVWAYGIGDGSLTEIGKHDDTIFGDSDPSDGSAIGTIKNGFTSDEESSGVIDVSSILGAGTYLLVTQAHSATKYTDGTDIPNIADVKEGGQLMVMTLAATADTTAPALRNWGFGARRGTTTVISRDALHAIDDRAPAASVTYTITTAPTKGQLRRDGAAATSFTQADIDAGLVAYAHTAGSGDAFDRFTFSVSDGTNSLTGQVLEISVGEALRVQKIGEYRIPSGYDADGGVAEIVAYDAPSRHIFVVNGKTNSVDVLSLSTDGKTAFLGTLTPADEDPLADDITSVAVRNGVLAVVAGNAPSGDNDAGEPGFLFFYDAATGDYLNHVDFSSDLDVTGPLIGVQPDMVTFTPDGTKALVAVEGQPSDDYTIDPHGGVVVVDLSFGVLVADSHATWCGFDSFEASLAALRAQGVRIFNDKADGTPAASVRADMEPEYIAVSADGTTAWVTCQENNALAVVNLVIPAITGVIPLGTKNWNAAGLSLDASNEDGGTNTNSGTPSVKLINAPIVGMYMPDGIAALRSGGATWLLTANEGDARDYGGLAEEVRLRSATRDAAWDTANPTAYFDSNLGRLNLSKYSGDTDSDGDIDIPHAFGARSFSVWKGSDGTLAWDSGSEMETFFSAYFAANFNANHNGSDNGFDQRSDDKGPEPEGVTMLTIGGKDYAAIGLERMGGFFLYDLSSPTAPTMAAYYTGRLFTGVPDAGTGGDLAPEGILSIPAADSPTGTDLIVVGNEVSGTVAIHAVVPAATDSLSGSGVGIADGGSGSGSGGGSSSSSSGGGSSSNCGAGGAVGLILAGLAFLGLRRRR